MNTNTCINNKYWFAGSIAWVWQVLRNILIQTPLRLGFGLIFKWNKNEETWIQKVWRENHTSKVPGVLTQRGTWASYWVLIIGGVLSRCWIILLNFSDSQQSATATHPECVCLRQFSQPPHQNQGEMWHRWSKHIDCERNKPNKLTDLELLPISDQWLTHRGKVLSWWLSLRLSIWFD